MSSVLTAWGGRDARTSMLRSNRRSKEKLPSARVVAFASVLKSFV